MERSQREKQWRRHVAGWRASGLTQRQYSQRSGLNVHTLAHWSRRLGQPVRDVGKSQALVPLRVTPVITQLSPSSVDLHYGAWRLSVPSGTDVAWLTALMKAVSSC